MTDGILVVDKPGGMTSHDVVARIRRLADTRRVGHAGTLDPMATGVLVVGLGKATRLLGHLTVTEKAYTGTIRLGSSTTTDDAQGETVLERDASGLTGTSIHDAAARFVGAIEQVPSQVSAIRVDGRRAYARVRAGEDVVLAARAVTVSALRIEHIDRPVAFPQFVDVVVHLECSSGTYVRAIARDLGEALGVGGHLTALRRTRVGPFDLTEARTFAELEERFELPSLSDATRRSFRFVTVDEDTARRLSHGGAIPATGLSPGVVAVFGPGGDVLALVEDVGAVARPRAVLA